MVHTYHHPVLLQECIQWLNVQPDSVIVDATLGGGGHSEGLLTAQGLLRIIAFDADPDAVETARKRLKPFGNRFTAICANFRSLATELEKLGVTSLQGLLLDLGVSSSQLDDPTKGFTYRREAPLLMKLGPSSVKSAHEVVNTMPEEELKQIFFQLGEEKNARRIARAILERRKEAPLMTTTQLADTVRKVIPERFAKKSLSRVFQAIRIYVNDELDSLKTVLHDAVTLLSPGGRLVVISYHSLEDRIVKEFFRFEAARQIENKYYPELAEPKEQRLRMLTRKPLTPSDNEIAENPRARSAKLRVAERV